MSWTVDDAAYYDVDAYTRYVSLHIVTTGMDASHVCTGRAGLGGVIDETGRVWGAPVWFYPDGAGQWSTYDVAGAPQHLTVGATGDDGEDLTGPALY